MPGDFVVIDAIGGLLLYDNKERIFDCDISSLIMKGSCGLIISIITIPKDATRGIRSSQSAFMLVNDVTLGWIFAHKHYIKKCW
jgi:hypothetical protein